jgi:hypothetical protein
LVLGRELFTVLRCGNPGLSDKGFQPFPQVGGRDLVEAVIDLAGVDEIVALAPADVAGGQDYEVRYDSKKTGHSAPAVKRPSRRSATLASVWKSASAWSDRI